MRRYRQMRGGRPRTDCRFCEGTGYQLIEIRLPDGRETTQARPCRHGRIASASRPSAAKLAASREPADWKSAAANDREED